jgi:urea transport system ATP-binding protein
LDEPTEGIQPSIIKDISRTLREIRDLKDLTIVVSEQVLSFVLDTCDRIMVIDKGKLVREDDRASVDADKIKAMLAV